MHRDWTYVAGERTEVLAVRNGIVYYNSRQRTGALSLATGKVVWEKVRSDWAQCSAIDEKTIFISASGMKSARLLSFDLKTGKQGLIRALPQEATTFALWKDRICILYPNRKLTCIDVKSNRNLWQTTVGDGKQRRGVSLDSVTPCGGVLVLAIEDIGWQCVDPSNGKALWSLKAQYSTNNRPSFLDGKVLLDAPQLTLVEPRTGKAVWSRPDLSLEFFGVTSGVLIGESEDRIIGLDLKSGKTVWAQSGGSPGFSAGSDRPAWIGDANGVIVCSDRFSLLTKTGKEIWGSNTFFDGWPAYVGNDGMVTSDGDRILHYVSGDYAKAPESGPDQKAFAENLVQHFEILDKTEREQVKALKKYSCEPLIRRFVEWANEEQKANAKEPLGDEFGMQRYGLLQDSGRMLSEMCSAEQTNALAHAIQEIDAKNSYRGMLVSILGKSGKPEDFIGSYVKELRANPPKPGSYSNQGETLKAVAESKEPVAVAFMIEALKNPHAPESWRHEAFVHLAGTGGEEGVLAVREARASRAERPKWNDGIDVGHLDKRALVSELKESAGRVWRLFHSNALGNYSDLFVSGKTDKGWSSPLFTGAFTEKTWHLEAPKEFRGMPIAQFVKTDWIKLMPNDELVRRDSDKDGLTDLVEKRWGTDPKNPDTDGDGLGDAVDPCPNAAPREMGDIEKIIAACVEARFFDDDWNAPAVISVEGVKPFEMYGYHHTLMWQDEKYAGELLQMYGGGMNTLGFHASGIAFEKTPVKKQTFEISADGKSATTLIRRYSGGLNGDGIGVQLIKIGNDWFVVGMAMEYVS